MADQTKTLSMEDLKKQLKEKFRKERCAIESNLGVEEKEILFSLPTSFRSKNDDLAIATLNPGCWVYLYPKVIEDLPSLCCIECDQIYIEDYCDHLFFCSLNTSQFPVSKP